MERRTGIMAKRDQKIQQQDMSQDAGMAEISVRVEEGDRRVECEEVRRDVAEEVGHRIGAN